MGAGFCQKWKGPLACLLYAGISVAITLFNKAVLSVYDFKYPNIMTLVQMIFSLICLVISKHADVISYPDFEWKVAKEIAPLSISFLGMVLTGLGALNYLNIPMFNAMRRVTTLITMYGQLYMANKKTSPLATAAVWTMVIGAMVAGAYDLTFSAIGYFLVTLNCFFTAGYLLYISKFNYLNSWGLMFYNNILSLPLVVLISVANGDFQHMQSFPYLYDGQFWVCFIFQASLAFFLNYAIFLSTNLNSPLATSVTGQVKSLLTTAAGYVMFGDVRYHILNVAGLVIGTFGSGWYAQVTYVEAQQKTKVVPQKSPV